MPLFVVRVWVPDRPGVLGAVASRIGSVRADVVGIDILERGGGRAVDELTIDIADAAHVSLVIAEINEVDGVDVEHVRPVRHAITDRAAESLDVASSVVAARGTDAILTALTTGVRRIVQADWTAVIDPSAGTAVAVDGGMEMPSAEWLAAFVIGTGAGEGSFAAVGELARASLPTLGHELVVSRDELPLREGERRMVSGLAAIADQRCAESA
jgi:hypothetical protein